MYLLYNIALLIFLPAVLGYHLYRSVSRGRPVALLQRFGWIGATIPVALNGKRPIWIHAVSVGETIAVKPLLSAIKKSYPGHPLILSNMTETGRAIALTIKEADHCIYFPFDYPVAVKRLLMTLNPALIVIVETELWPNFLRSARWLSIPTIVVNGRISDRSFKKYMGFKAFFAPVLEHVSAFCMQSDEDAQRIMAMGAESERVRVTRNLKFDIPAQTPDALGRQSVLAEFRLPGGTALLTAGSTHPGEEELVLSAFSDLLKTGEDGVLILVPRHPERASEVAELLYRKGFSFVLRSRLGEHNGPLSAGEVLLVDTIGELMRLYSVSDLVFVGGSLVPIGGHNLLEPASLGRPVLFGPHMANFREISALAIKYGAAVEVPDGAALGTAFRSLLADREARRIMGENGRRMLSSEGGATGLNMAVIAELLPDGNKRGTNA